MRKSIKELVEDLGKLQGIDTIMLGGSQATGKPGKDSDYDLYIYSTKDVDLAQRRQLLEKHCQYLEFNNQFWETEDDGQLHDGTKINILYRTFSWIENELTRVVFQHQASIGYTTCFWHNVITSKILFDRSNKGTKLQEKYTIAYPLQLKQNIIAKNYPILGSIQDSYQSQITSAVFRKDVVSVQHRITAFLASYFDILFAINELPHPGEKRIVPHLTEHATLLPKGFTQDLDTLFEVAPGLDEKVVRHMNLMLDRLTILLVGQGLYAE